MSKPENDKDPTNEENLMFSVFPGPRIFILNNEKATPVLGMLLEEYEDSFLVALPSRLIEGENGNTIEPLMPIAYFRLMKNTVMAVSYPYGEFAEKYSKYLLEVVPTAYPEMEDVLEDITKSITEFKDSAVDGDEDEVEKGDEEDNTPARYMGPKDAKTEGATFGLNVGLGKEVKEGSSLSGLSDKELKEYLANRFK